MKPLRFVMVLMLAVAVGGALHDLSDHQGVVDDVVDLDICDLDERGGAFGIAVRSRGLWL